MSQENFKSTFIYQILKFLKIFLHTFLYIKHVYPKETFERIKIFGTFGWYSKSNLLQEYVQQTLHSLYHMIYDEKLRLIVIEVFHELSHNNRVTGIPNVMQMKCHTIPLIEANMYNMNNVNVIHDSKSLMLLQFDHSFCKGNSIFRTILNHYCIHQNNVLRKHHALNGDNSYNNRGSIEKHMYECFLSEDSEFVISFRTALNSLLKQQTLDMTEVNKIPLSFSIAIQGTDDFLNSVSPIVKVGDTQNNKLVKSLILSNWTPVSNEMLDMDNDSQANELKKRNNIFAQKKLPFSFPNDWVQEILITLRGGGLVENIGIPFFHISVFSILETQLS